MMETDLSEVFDRLFPINRSITGPGLRDSLEIMSEYIPLKVHSVKSGSEVLDWTVPKEWAVESARLIGPSGDIICDFDDNNLHLVNYSVPHSGVYPLEKINEHLHSLPHLPDAIPYVTSYYNERWGFCITDRKRKILKTGDYTVDIKANIYDGEVNFATASLPGDSEETILISSYLCHPSMANNELSGPLGLLRLYEHLAAMPTRRHSYEFLLCPETIGSIAYLATFGRDLAPKLRAGLVLTCLGGPRPSLSAKLSRQDWLGGPSAIDLHARRTAEEHPNSYELREFTPTSGSDERQFCSPGFNWPVIQIARTVYGQFAEYHSSADDKRFMRIEQVEKAADQIADFLEVFDYDGLNLKNTCPHGEPQLGRRGLYPTLNSPMNRGASNDQSADSRVTLNRLLMILSLADGDRGLSAIAQKIGCSASALLPIVRELRSRGILETQKISS